MKKTLFILILAGLSALGYSQMLGGFVQVGGGSLTPQNLSNEGQSSINFNNIFGFPDSLQIAAWAHETTSRTIYVATTGSDVTGTGAVGAPYATVGKALSTINKVINAGVTVTVSIGVGTFTVSAADLTVLSGISGAGTLTIQGTLTLVESGFTMGSADANDPLKYAVSGGNTGTWTTNQWKYYYLYNGSYYFPITHNTTTTISLTNATTGSNIYQVGTIIDLQSNTIISTFCLTTFSRIKLTTTNSLSLYSINTLAFQNCVLESNAAKILTINGPTSILNTCSNNLAINYKSVPETFVNNYIYKSSSYCIAFSKNITPASSGFQFVAENAGTSQGDVGLYLYSLYSTIPNTINYYWKFVNINTAIGIMDNVGITRKRSTTFIILSNCNYVFRNQSTADGNYFPINIILSNTLIYGAPNVRWFYDNMYEFVNPSAGRNIRIDGLIYPEIDQNKSSALIDNTTTNVIVGNKLQNRSIVLDYTIKRGTTYEVGRIKVLNDGTNLTIQEDTPLGDVGVTFAVDYNTNEIRLNCALTSTGTGATIYYNAQRVMITPLTL